MQRLTLAGSLLASAISLAAQSPLTTTFANNNGGGVGGAVYFDMTATVAVTITGIDINLSTAATTPGTIDIYRCANTYVGNEANQAAWTLIGSGAVTSNGAGTPSTLALTAPIPILPGSAGYAYVGVGHSFAYTNGNGTNQTYSTTELTLNAGAAVNVAFSGTPFTPRVVNTSISYVVSGTAYATKSLFGDGCYDAPRMVYEKIPTDTTPIDLVNTQWTLIYTNNANGGNYIILPIGPAYDGATPATNGVDLIPLGYTSSSSANWDDASIVRTLSATTFPTGFPFPGPGGGSTTDITVNSNGKIYLANTTSGTFATNGSNYGSLVPFQTLQPQLSPFNTDLDPSVGGNIWYEDPSPNGGVRITWAGVPNWPAVPGITNDIQMELLPSGQVTIAYGANLANNGLPNQNDAIVGFSAGNGEPLSTMVDWSAITALTTGDGSVALALDGSARPVVGTTVNMTLTNIPGGSPLAAVIYGLAQFNPGLSLASVGMPGCFQYCSQDAVVLVIGPSASTTNAFAIPNDPGLAGVTVTVQGGAYNPGVIPNVIGATSSNGVSLFINLN